MIFTKRLCDVLDDELNRITEEVGSRKEDKLSCIVDHAVLKKNDYNISLSRYIHTAEVETYRPIAEIVAELEAVEAVPKRLIES